MSEADRAIMAFIRESRRAATLPRVGSFALLVNRRHPLRYLNYAIPDDGADPDAAAVGSLVAAFRTADRMPRVEFLPSVAPALEARLTSHGWTVEDRLPLMTCTTGSLHGLRAPDGVVIEAPVGRRHAARDGHACNTTSSKTPNRWTIVPSTRLRDTLTRGGRALMARDTATGRMVGAAQAGPPAGGATEVVGVVVAPSHRRRGLAATMVSALAHQCFEAGLTTVFLEAAPGADGAYRNAGIPADVQQRAHIVGA